MKGIRAISEEVELNYLDVKAVHWNRIAQNLNGRTGWEQCLLPRRQFKIPTRCREAYFPSYKSMLRLVSTALCKTFPISMPHLFLPLNCPFLTLSYSSGKSFPCKSSPQHHLCLPPLWFCHYLLQNRMQYIFLNE